MIILGTNSIKDTGYNVANSYRSNSGDSPRLSKTFSSASNSRTTFTISAWFKRSKLGATQDLISAYRSADGFQTDVIRFGSADDLEFYAHSANSSGNCDIQTNRLFRDINAWYHVVIRVDTTQGTDTNRVRIYVNGVQETSFSTSNYMSQNGTIIWGLGSGTEHTIGAVGTSNYFGGYVAEVVYLDSQSVAPTTFGEFDEDSGIWKPIDVSGLTFGTNGFYLDFEDSANLGNDANGGTDLTEANLTATDQSTDTCTNNFATMNPLDNFYASSTFSEGNTNIVTDASSKAANTSTFGINSGKWYCEIKAVQIYNGNAQFGIKGKVSTSTSDGVGEGTDGYCYTASGGNKINNGSASSFGTTWNNNDIIGIAVDLDNNKLYFSRNGTWQNSGDPTSGATGTGSAFNIGTPSSGFYFIATSDNDTSSGSANNYLFNFGNAPFTISSGNTDGNGYGNFEYAVPSGYYSLNTKNLAEYG